jgi:hypothetical protein
MVFSRTLVTAACGLLLFKRAMCQAVFAHYMVWSQMAHDLSEARSHLLLCALYFEFSYMHCMYVQYLQ